MNTVADYTLQHAMIENAVQEVFDVDEFHATDEDVALIHKIIDHSRTSGLIVDLVDEYIRIDSKTGRLMCAGWVVFDGEYHFANMQDAEEAVKESGYKSIEHANAEHATADDDCPIAYFTDWYEFT